MANSKSVALRDLLILIVLVLIGVNAFAQAVLNPNQISGVIEFTNTNPEILQILSPEGDDEGFKYSYIRANSVGISPTLNNYAYPQAEGATKTTYEITVESQASGLKYSVAPEIRLDSYNGRYIFDAIESAPVYPEPEGDVILNFKQCVSMLKVLFIDEEGNPVQVQGGKIRALRETTVDYSYGSYTQYRLQAEDWRIPNGAQHEYLAIHGDGSTYRIDVTYQFGTDAYSNQVQALCQEYVHSATCDEIEEILCVIPPAAELGQITGEVDMVGANEHNTNYLTRMRAFYGPFDNYRYDHLNTFPSQGSFLLENLVPSDTVSPANPTAGPRNYAVYGEMLFGTGRRAQYFRTPWLYQYYNGGVAVEAGKTADLGNTFVIQPGTLSGNVLVAGPLHQDSCLKDLQHVGHYDYNKDGIPDNYTLYGDTSVEAQGSYTQAAGATYKAWGGTSRVGIAGALNPETSNFLGNYNMKLGGLKGESSFWKTKMLALAFYDSPYQQDQLHNYQYSRLQIYGNDNNDLEIRPGTSVQQNHAYCVSEVNLSYRALSGKIYQPRVWGNGDFKAEDFQDNAANYRVYLNHAYGTPRSQAQASDKGMVKMCLPQGHYKLTPNVTALNPSGGTSNTELRAVELDVGCRQLIDVTTALQINLNELPQLTTLPAVQLSGAVKGDGNVTRLTYSVNGKDSVLICDNCGVSPNFSVAVPLAAGANAITVAAQDEFDNNASVTSRVTYNPPPSVELFECKDLTLYAETGNKGATVKFNITASKGCDSAPNLTCIPFSGSWFELGETAVACKAQDSCGSKAECAFKVTVLELEDEEDEEKTVICHLPPGNPENAHTLEIGAAAVDAHLAHGDHLGECKPNDDDDDDDSDDDDDEDNKDKSVICHLPPGNTDNPQTLEVAESAVKAHLKHGDYLGECKSDDDGDDDDDSDDDDSDDDDDDSGSCAKEKLVPVVSCALDAPFLWSPDHKFIDVGHKVEAKNDCSASGQQFQSDKSSLEAATKIWSDETEVPQPGDYSGRHAPDAKFEGSTLLLRSERRGIEDGRVYLIINESQNEAGKRAFACCAAVVPHDLSKKSKAKAIAQRQAALDYCQANGGKPPVGYTEHGVNAELGPQKVRVAQANKNKSKKKNKKQRRQVRKRLKAKAARFENL
ncbi:HYR domain-containing protein [Oligoflexia bacterium]|nr:HYR domain-containing protein [Oligoflexia bacterium]